MAIKAATKSKRLAKALEALDAHDQVTANLQAKLDVRKAARKVLEHDLKVLKMTRTADGVEPSDGE